MSITIVEYMYRDGSNYKAYAQFAVAGEFTEEQVARIKATLKDTGWDEPNGFIPEAFGWDHAGAAEFGNLNYEDDHPWHELSLDDRTVVEDDPRYVEPWDAEEIVVMFETAKAQDWREMEFLR